MAETQKKSHSHREAAEAAGERPEGPWHGVDQQCLDLCPICRTADVLRATVPPEVQDHWHAWQREALLALRALLDHYIEGVEAKRRSAVAVEEIPIE